MTTFHTIPIPHNGMEEKLMDDFQAGRDRVQQEVEKSVEQGSLL